MRTTISTLIVAAMIALLAGCSSKGGTTDTGGAAVEDRTVDLTSESVRFEVGDDRASVTQIIDAKQVTTLLQSTIDDATLTSNNSIGITLGGIDQLQSKLPSRGMVSTLHSLNHAVTQALR